MENIQEIVNNILQKNTTYQKNGNYYGFYDINMYNKELELISNTTYEHHLHTLSFAVFRSALYNWNMGDSIDLDFQKYATYLRNRKINELRNATIILPISIKIKSDNIAFLNKFEEDIKTPSSPFIIVSFHYSAYSSIINYLLYNGFDVTCLASRKLIDKNKERVEVCCEIMNKAYEVNSKIEFVCANDYDSLLRLGTISEKETSSTNKKVILLFMDGNVGSQKMENFNRLVKVNFLERNIYVRKGCALLAKSLGLPIYTVVIDETSDGELYIDILDHVKLFKSSLDDFVRKSYLNLEKKLKEDNYFKWECWLYIHSWIKKESSSDSFIVDKDDILDINRFTYICSGKNRYVFDSKSYLSYLISEDENKSKLFDTYPLQRILNEMIKAKV
jgi:hypothetical protein